MFFIVIIGLLFVVFSAVGIALLVYDHKKMTRCTASTTGIVVRNEYQKVQHHHHTGSSMNYSSGCYYPVVSFNGVELISKEGQNPAKYREGQSVRIYFNPADYRDFRIDEVGLEKIIGFVFSGVGVLLLIILCILIRVL